MQVCTHLTGYRPISVSLDKDFKELALGSFCM